MSFKRRVILNRDGSVREEFVTRISEEGFLEWSGERDALREQGYPDRPPDVDTPTHRGWVEHPGESELPYFAEVRAEAADADATGLRVFAAYSAAFRQDPAFGQLRAAVNVDGFSDGGLLIRGQVADGEEVTMQHQRAWPPEAPLEAVHADLENLLERLAEVGNPKVATYDDFEAIEAEYELARADVERGFVMPMETEATAQ